MINTKICIIGAGNMGQAIAKGLLGKKIINASNLLLTNKHPEKLSNFEKQGVITTSTNIMAVKNADIVILSVEPQAMKEVLKEIKEEVSNQLIISIAAGVSVQTISSILCNSELASGSSLKVSHIVRVMPNLCASIGKSVSLWTTTKKTYKEEGDRIKTILSAIGTDLFVESEDIIDKLTPISGSGPAYVFFLAELLEKSAKEIGLSSKEASLVVKQVLLGSVDLLVQTKHSPEDLRQRVTSKKGITERVFEVFEKEKVKDIFKKGIQEGFKRAKELNQS